MFFITVIELSKVAGPFWNRTQVASIKRDIIKRYADKGFTMVDADVDTPPPVPPGASSPLRIKTVERQMIKDPDLQADHFIL